MRNIVSRNIHENRVGNKGRIAPKKIFNETDERWIVMQVKKDPSISAPKLTAEVEKRLHKLCNPETVRWVLRSYQFHACTTRKKKFINARSRKIYESNGKTFIWKHANIELKPKNLRGTVKHGGGHVMV